MTAHRLSDNKPRIPVALQAVFLASNRGRDIHKPPPQRVASRVFGAFIRRSDSMPSSKSSSLASSLAPKHRRRAPPKRSTFRHSSQKTSKPAIQPTLSPQAFLDSAMRSRGYSTRRFKALQTAYHNKDPTPLQQASHGAYLLDLIRNEDCTTIARLLEAGISPNPANRHGDSVVHMVCRRGLTRVLHTFVAGGASVQIADRYGRTPLHDACWVSNNWGIIRLLLESDVRLVSMTDGRGATPLSYIHRDDWGGWHEFLQDSLDKYWPKRNVLRDGEQGVPELAELPANGRPLADPEKALSPELAEMVVSGRMEPDEAQFLTHNVDDENGEDDDTDEENGNGNDDDNDSRATDDESLSDLLKANENVLAGLDNSENSFDTFCDDEMNDLLAALVQTTHDTPDTCGLEQNVLQDALSFSFVQNKG